MSGAERAAVTAQYLLPKQALTAFAGLVANAQAGALTTALIRWFIGRYGVDMTEAADPDPAAYVSFNAFFTRHLAPGVRPLAQADWLCPVDGAISQFGRIERGRIFQSKGHDYSAQALVGGDEDLAAQFDDGHFATLYLSPKDYHRVHMPRAARLRRMLHVPGKLFSVNPVTARGVPGLFARNERVVCVFESSEASAGPVGSPGAGGAVQTWVLVLVGATIVGSMATVWHGCVNPPRRSRVRDWRYEEPGLQLGQGDEMGCFQLGSTVVLLLPPGPLDWNPGWAAGGAIRMGEVMARRA